MFIYNKHTDQLINSQYISSLTVLHRGKKAGSEVWSVVVFMAGTDNYGVLSDHESKKEAETALSMIADALEAGRTVYTIR